MFIINEQVLNGTVTMSIHSIVVNVDTWEEAKRKLLDLENEGRIKILQIDESVVEYTVPQNDTSLFKLWAEMKNENITVL